MEQTICVNAPLALAGTRNTRELGGYPAACGRKTRRHAFLRSDGLSGLTDKDVQMLLDYGVCCVVDLRSESETAAAPSRLADVPGVDYYSIPMLDEAASQGFTGGMPERMGDVYVKLLSGRGDAFARMIRIFAQHSDGTVLFNCTAGKDRTGVTAMLLLLLAGVPCEIVVADYSVSEANMQEIFKQQKAWLEKTFGVTPPDAVFSSAPEELETALAYLAEHYGTAESYLLQAGAAAQDIAVVHERPGAARTELRSGSARPFVFCFSAQGYSGRSPPRSRCSSSAPHPSHTSAYVASKSPVYQGSAISRG